MTSTAKSRLKFLLCVRNDGSEDLELRKVYQVLADRSAAREGYVRVIDESGEDYIYPRAYFVPVKLPVKAVREWVTSGGAEERVSDSSRSH